MRGAHGTGKSSLVLALTAYYKARDIHAVGLSELARQSPFVEDVVIHERGTFDITAELHLLASQIAQEQALARFHDVVVCDKTVANVLGYAHLLIEDHADSFTREMLAVIVAFCRVYVRQYDAVVYVSDFYELSRTDDPFRPKDPMFQRQADESIRRACAETGLGFLELPTGLSLEEKVKWVAGRVAIRRGH